MNPNFKHALFFLGVRIAIIPALICGVVVSGTLLLLSSPLLAVICGIFAAILTFAITYFFTERILRKRLKILSDTFDNISRKHFDETPDAPEQKWDELDFLLEQAHNAGDKVNKEFTRLHRIENYRKEFIGDISHELKTPTFAVQGFIETLLDGAVDDPEVNRKFLEKAMSNANRLNSLTKDLMEISRLETGELKLVKETLSLNGIISEIVENLQHKANQEGVSLEFDETYKDVYVEADQRQLKQALINLIDNGIKYNKPNGKVTVSMNREETIYSKILVTVTDTGIGMAPEEAKRVTERFFRVDKSRSREKGGTGLGLSIVKHIIEAHKETLTIDSEPNQGTTFAFSLKLSHKKNGIRKNHN